MIRWEVCEADAEKVRAMVPSDHEIVVTEKAGCIVAIRSDGEIAMRYGGRPDAAVEAILKVS